MAALTVAEAVLMYARLTGVTEEEARNAILLGMKRGEIEWDPALQVGGGVSVIIEPCEPDEDSPIIVQSFEHFLEVRRRLLSGNFGSTEAGGPEKPLASRERKTLLTIIAALAKEAKIDITKPYEGANIIEAMTDQFGAHVDSDTIAKKLKLIDELLKNPRK